MCFSCGKIFFLDSTDPFSSFLHRVTRPLRGSVSCGSGCSVPCVSIQLTLSQAVVAGRYRYLGKKKAHFPDRERRDLYARRWTHSYGGRRS